MTLTEAADQPGPNVPEYTVSELSLALKRTVEGAYERVRVRGELSGVKRAASCHLYMSMKDDKAVLDVVCWRATAGRLRFAPEDGLEVVCTGKLTTYPGRSKYQLIVESMEPAGLGALMALLEERKKKLAAEGLFDEARKQALPYLPAVIGVVTSPTGAVIRDILHRLRERFPRRVLLWPVLVQGEGAAREIAAAIEGFNALDPSGPVPRPDLLIVARGGGSIEDLWAFNEEIVVRAAAASEIPLVSAVGHETDTTLIDLAADRRAPTPTAAAEMAVPVRAELAAGVIDLERRLVGTTTRLLERRRSELRGLSRGLRDPREMLANAVQRLDDLGERLRAGLGASVTERRARLAEAAAPLRPRLLAAELRRLDQVLSDRARAFAREIGRHLGDLERRLTAQAKLLASYSYAQVLERGYAVVRDADERVIASAAAARAGAQVSIEFKDGRRGARLGDGARPAPAKRGAKDDPDQGSLI